MIESDLMWCWVCCFRLGGGDASEKVTCELNEKMESTSYEGQGRCDGILSLEVA